MLTTSAAFKNAIASEDREIRAYLKFNGSTILRGVDGLVSIEWDQSVYDEERLCIGCAVSSFITAEFFDNLTGVDFKNSYVEAFVGVVLEDTGTAPSGSIEPDTATVEYVSLGRFDITDSVTKNGKTVITAYDKLSKLSGEYTPSISAGANGYAIADIVNDVLTQSGVGGSVSGDYGYVQKIQASTYREQLKYCLTMMVQNGSSYILARTNDTLKMTSVIGQDATQLTITDSTTYIDGMDEQPSFTISSLQATTGTDVYTFGSGQGIEISNPYITNAQASAIYNSMEGFSYLPIRLEFRGNPAIDPGDVLTLTAGGKNTKIVAMRIRSTFNGGFKSTIDCYGNTETYYAMSESPTGTRITQAENMIRLEAERATAAEGSLSSLIDINAEGISLVSEKLNNIGGRNLIINTLEPSVATIDQLPRFLEQPTYTSTGTGISRVVLLPHGFKALKGTSAYRPAIQFNDSSHASLCGLEAGETYTFSAKCVWKVSTANPLRLIMAPYVNGTLVPSEDRPKIFWDPTTVGADEEKYVVFTFTVPEGATSIILQYNQPAAAYTDYAETDYIGLDMIKLERGTVATAWTPAPEDMVGNNEIIAKINVSPENITISANKVDLQGYVTFSNLSTSGQTAIDGGNITTGTISADRIGASSIKASKIDLTDLFSQNITATNFNITGGSVNITTGSSTTDLIQLNGGVFSSSMRPIGFVAQKSDNGTMAYYQAESITLYPNSQNLAVTSFYVNRFGNLTLGDYSYGSGSIQLKGTDSTEVYASSLAGVQVRLVSDNTSRAILGYDSSGGNLIFQNAGTVRTRLDNSGLTFSNSSGTVTASYPASGLMSIGKAFYNANTDRTVLSNRTAAILANVVRADFEGFKGFSVRYSGGYYYSYFVINPSKVQGEMVIIEVSPYGNGEISIFTIDGTNTITLKRTI